MEKGIFLLKDGERGQDCVMSYTVLLTLQYSPCPAAMGIDGIGRLVGKGS